MKESELFDPLKKYFNERGFLVYGEVPYSYNSATDVVAAKDGHHIGIEMKVCMNNDVCRQAYYQTFIDRKRFNEVYVAVGVRKPNQKKIDFCKQHGIGVLTVFKGEVIELLKPKWLEVDEYKDFTGWKEGETAGLRNNGTSSAKDVLMRIKLYLETHPEADWKEIFKNVQNHYSSHSSMKNSMLKFQGYSLPPRWRQESSLTL